MFVSDDVSFIPPNQHSRLSMYFLRSTVQSSHFMSFPSHSFTYVIPPFFIMRSSYVFLCHSLSPCRLHIKIAGQVKIGDSDQNSVSVLVWDQIMIELKSRIESK